MFSNVYKGLNVLVVGHTGFKGSWLTLWLEKLGAKVSGLSLAPTEPSHYNLLQTQQDNYFTDIRNYDEVKRVIRAVSPDVVFHLAAQPIVSESYENPISTWETNVMGTMHLLEACRREAKVKVFLNVTTDKVYKNEETSCAYTEQSTLGGVDPYSASKSASELLSKCYIESLSSDMKVISLRAGNVIGGGDWGSDRLITDIVTTAFGQNSLSIRNPHGVRPWQHVLDCLSGYLSAGEFLLTASDKLSALNIGPDDSCCIRVQDILDSAKASFPWLDWEVEQDVGFKESSLLRLDNGLAQEKLNWVPVWKVEEALKDTFTWYEAYYKNGSVNTWLTLEKYINDAKDKKVDWAIS